MNVYAELFGLKSIINAQGTVTVLGGSLMAPETVAAMRRAAEDWVYLPDLLEAASREVAALLGAPAAAITSGAAAGNTLATAAVLAGGDEKLMEKLPHTEGFPNEVVIQSAHASGWLSTFRAAGARIKIAGQDPALNRNRGEAVEEATPAAVEAAIGKETCALAAILSGGSSSPTALGVSELARIARRHNLPLIVDAAAQIPPVSNVKRLLNEGADLVIVSGGKAIGGPNDTGIVVGRPDLVASCVRQSNPNTISIGRGFKVSKEQIVGLVVALRKYAAEDAEARLAREWARIEAIEAKLTGLPNVRLSRQFPDESGLPVPRLRVGLDERKLGRTASAVAAELRRGDPQIHLRGGYESLGELNVDVQVLREGEAEIVGDRLRAALT